MIVLKRKGKQLLVPFVTKFLAAVAPGLLGDSCNFFHRFGRIFPLFQVLTALLGKPSHKFMPIARRSLVSSVSIILEPSLCVSAPFSHLGFAAHRLFEPFRAIAHPFSKEVYSPRAFASSSMSSDGVTVTETGGVTAADPVAVAERETQAAAAGTSTDGGAGNESAGPRGVENQGTGRPGRPPVDLDQLPWWKKISKKKMTPEQKARPPVTATSSGEVTCPCRTPGSPREPAGRAREDLPREEREQEAGPPPAAAGGGETRGPFAANLALSSVSAHGAESDAAVLSSRRSVGSRSRG